MMQNRPDQTFSVKDGNGCRTKIVKHRWIALLTILILPFCASDVIGGSTLSGKFEWSFAFRYSPSYDFSNFPLSIRSVPLHEDDGHLADLEPATGPLPDKRLPLHRPRAYDITLVYYPLSFAGLGMVYTLHQNPHAKIDSDQRYQQNQFGTAVRSDVASLRWYQPATAKYSQIGPAVSFASSWKSITGPLRFRAKGIAVYDLTGLELLVESGWDRFN